MYTLVQREKERARGQAWGEGGMEKGREGGCQGDEMEARLLVLWL